jgi:Zn ribbon nucleic-acid-binding protein
VDVGFEAQVAAAGVEGVDHANAHIWVELLRQLADCVRCGFEEQLQERAVGVEEEPEEIVDGEGDVKVGHVVEIAGDVGNPVIDFDLAAGRAEAGLARERDTAVKAAAGADIAGIAGAGIAAEDHAFDDLANVGALIGWDLVCETQMAPGVPMIAEDAAEAVVGGGVIGVAPRG